MKNLCRCLLFFPLLLCGFFWSDPTWEQIEKEIHRKYPGVPSIEIEDLRELLLKNEVVLIDVRTAEEFAVSHLPGAVNLTEADKPDYPKSTPIVVYCSVGVRSAAFARQLQQRGFTRVRNLRGSIFAWANSGYPLQRGDREVRVVHPFNKRWGVLLKKELHQYRASP